MRRPEGFDRDHDDGVTWRTIRFEAIENGWRPATNDNAATAPKAPEPEKFVRGDGGEILKAHPQNTKAAIRRLGVGVRYNEFSTQAEITGFAGFGPELTDAAASERVFELALIDIAHSHKFHPVRDWLYSLQWDSVPRINNWLHD